MRSKTNCLIKHFSIFSTKEKNISSNPFSKIDKNEFDSRILQTNSTSNVPKCHAIPIHTHRYTHIKKKKENKITTNNYYCPISRRRTDEYLTIPQFSSPFTRPSIHPSIPRLRIHPPPKTSLEVE